MADQPLQESEACAPTDPDIGEGARGHKGASVGACSQCGESSGHLDYFGVRVTCGCVTAWLSEASTEDERSRFFRRMLVSGRDVIQGTLDEYRERLVQCPHMDVIDEFVDVVPRSVAEALAEALKEATQYVPSTPEPDGPRMRIHDALADYRAAYPKETR